MTEPQRILALSQFEGKKPKFMKGIHSPSRSYWKCGNCGTILKHDVLDNYCFNCGYMVLWDSPRCLTGYKKEENSEMKNQMTLSDFI